MMRVKERRPQHRIQAQLRPQKEWKLGWVKQASKANSREAKEPTSRWGIGDDLLDCLSQLVTKDEQDQKHAPVARRMLQGA